jgi:hypothetical protein
MHSNINHEAQAKCCLIEMHKALNKYGEYVVFPAEKVHRGFFSAENKIVVTAQLFCGYNSNSLEMPRVNCSVSDMIGVQRDTIKVSADLSNSVSMHWDKDFQVNMFKLLK